MRISGIVSCRRTGAGLRTAAVGMILSIVASLLLCFPMRSANAAPGMAPYEGYIDGADCNQIFGWVYDQAFPNDPLFVDIFSDGNFIGTVYADQFRQDLADLNKGNGFHAFSFPTPMSVKDGQNHAITAMVSGTNVSLGSSPRIINCPGTQFEGYFDEANCGQLSGWVWDASRPNEALSVDLYVDNNNFISVTAPANKFRQDLFNLGKGNGFHAFSFATPEFLKDGMPHTLRIKISGTQVELGTSPRTINCPAVTPPEYEGFVDGANCNVIFGWVWDANQPNTPLDVDIYADGMVIATIPANQFRQDLQDAGKGNGVHAFSFAVPMSLKDGAEHRITVGIHGTFVGLQQTPRFITCPPPFEGFLDGANCNQIFGWAWRADTPNTPISVDIYADGIFVQTVLADQFRQDLQNTGKGNGNHAFSFPTPAFLKDNNPHSISARYAGTNIELGTSPRGITCAP